MNNKEERLKNIENEDFYFVFMNGTYMPNNKKYRKIIMFDDVFYIETELESKEYPDIYFILKTKKLFQENIEKIKKMSELMSENNIRSSYNSNFTLKIDNQIYKINRNLCNDEGKKIFDEFSFNLYEILGINDVNNKNQLIETMQIWKQNNTSDNFRKLIQNIIIYKFYCPIRDNNGSQVIATIKNSKGETLLPAFSSKDELYKWIKVSDKEIKKLTFKNYSDILLSDGNINIGMVIDPFGANIVLDKKIVSDILKSFC